MQPARHESQQEIEEREEQAEVDQAGRVAIHAADGGEKVEVGEIHEHVLVGQNDTGGRVHHNIAQEAEHMAGRVPQLRDA